MPDTFSTITFFTFCHFQLQAMSYRNTTPHFSSKMEAGESDDDIDAVSNNRNKEKIIDIDIDAVSNNKNKDKNVDINDVTIPLLQSPNINKSMNASMSDESNTFSINNTGYSMWPKKHEIHNNNNIKMENVVNINNHNHNHAPTLPIEKHNNNKNRYILIPDDDSDDDDIKNDNDNHNHNHSSSIYDQNSNANPATIKHPSIVQRENKQITSDNHLRVFQHGVSPQRRFNDKKDKYKESKHKKFARNHNNTNNKRTHHGMNSNKLNINNGNYNVVSNECHQIMTNNIPKTQIPQLSNNIVMMNQPQHILNNNNVKCIV